MPRDDHEPVDVIMVEVDRPRHGLPPGIIVGGVQDAVPTSASIRARAKRRKMVRHRSETAIQEACKAELLIAGGYVVVTTASKYMQTGTPDLLGCASNGRFVAVEVKRPGEEPRSDQYGELRRWQKAGALVGWACHEDDIGRLLAHVDDREWTNPLTGPGDGSSHHDPHRSDSADHTPP